MSHKVTIAGAEYNKAPTHVECEGCGDTHKSSLESWGYPLIVVRVFDEDAERYFDMVACQICADVNPSPDYDRAVRNLESRKH